MDHAITIGEVLITAGIIGVPVMIIAGALWVLSKIDFSH